MKTRHLVLSVAAVALLAACTQSGFRNVDYTLDNAVGDYHVVRLSTLEKHAVGGEPEAQRMLGNMYYWGEHVEHSESKAVAWWSRAADKGDEEAQLNLARVNAGETIRGLGGRGLFRRDRRIRNHASALPGRLPRRGSQHGYRTERLGENSLSPR